MGNWSNGSPIGVLKRLAVALLVAFALTATPMLVEPIPATAQALQEQTTPKETAEGVLKRGDEKKDKDDKKGDGGGGSGPLGEGSGY